MAAKEEPHSGQDTKALHRLKISDANFDDGGQQQRKTAPKKQKQQQQRTPTEQKPYGELTKIRPSHGKLSLQLREIVQPVAILFRRAPTSSASPLEPPPLASTLSGRSW